MYCKRIGIILLLIATAVPAGLFAQAGSSDSTIEDEESVSEGFSLSLDFRTGFNVLGFVPGIPAIIGVPISISADSIRITPQFGFLYYFDVWTDLHNPYYIPLGMSIIYNPVLIGLDVLFFPPVGGGNTNSILSTAVVSEFEILKNGQFSFLFELKFGPAFVFEPAGTRVLTMVDCAFIPRLRL